MADDAPALADCTGVPMLSGYQNGIVYSDACCKMSSSFEHHPQTRVEKDVTMVRAALHGRGARVKSGFIFPILGDCGTDRHHRGNTSTPAGSRTISASARPRVLESALIPWLAGDASRSGSTSNTTIPFGSGCTWTIASSG